MNDRINYEGLNVISMLLSMFCIGLAISVFFTHMFWYMPGVFIFGLSLISSLLGVVYSARIINSCTLIITVIAFIIFSYPLF